MQTSAARLCSEKRRFSMSIKLFLAMAVAMLGISGTAFAAGDIPVITDIQAPVGMVYDAQGNLFVAEWGAGRVSKFDPQGKRSTVTDAVRSPSGLAFDDKGTLFVASYADGNVYRLDADGTPRSIASGFSSPTGLLWASDNTLLVANRNAGEIVRIFADGRKEVISRGHKTPVGVAQTAGGAMYVSCYGGSVDRIGPDGKPVTVCTSLNTPGVGIIADGEAVLVVDYGGTTVARVTPDGKTAPVAQGLRSPVGLARMPDGRIIVGTWSDSAAFVFAKPQQ